MSSECFGLRILEHCSCDAVQNRGYGSEERLFEGVDVPTMPDGEDLLEVRSRLSV